MIDQLPTKTPDRILWIFDAERTADELGSLFLDISSTQKYRVSLAMLRAVMEKHANVHEAVHEALPWIEADTKHPLLLDELLVLQPIFPQKGMKLLDHHRCAEIYARFNPSLLFEVGHGDLWDTVWATFLLLYQQTYLRDRLDMGTLTQANVTTLIEAAEAHFGGRGPFVQKTLNIWVDPRTKENREFALFFTLRNMGRFGLPREQEDRPDETLEQMLRLIEFLRRHPMLPGLDNPLRRLLSEG